MVCLDASLALKLLVGEEDSARARSLWRSWIATGVEVVAPGLFVFECVSALRRMVVRKDLEEERTRSAMGLLGTMPVSLRVPQGLVERAWAIATELDRPTAYDSFSTWEWPSCWASSAGRRIVGSSTPRTRRSRGSTTSVSTFRRPTWSIRGAYRIYDEIH